MFWFSLFVFFCSLWFLPAHFGDTTTDKKTVEGGILTTKMKLPALLPTIQRRLLLFYLP
jgi:hypothetical protein